MRVCECGQSATDKRTYRDLRAGRLGRGRAGSCLCRVAAAWQGIWTETRVRDVRGAGKTANKALPHAEKVATAEPDRLERNVRTDEAGIVVDVWDDG